MYSSVTRKRFRQARKQGWPALFLVVVSFAGFVLVALSWAWRLEGWSHGGMDDDITTAGGERHVAAHVREWTQFVHYGARYLMRMVRDGDRVRGRFIYTLYESGTFKEESYNVLRHAGAVFAMASYIQWAPRHSAGYRAVGLDEMTEKTAQAVEYLKVAFLKPFSSLNTTTHRVKALALWDEPTLIGTHSHAARCAKLGGAGLGLVALTSFEAIRPGTTRHEDLKLLAEFIIFMQRDDGGFASKYCDGIGIDTHFQSLYYPGEASLGMVRLYELTRKKQYLVVALRGLLYLADTRENSASVEADHWALLATERLLTHLHVLRIQDEIQIRRRLLYHGDQIVQSLAATTADMLQKTRMNATGNPPWPTNGRTTPTATRLEGFMAAISFSEKIKEFQIRENAYVSARFLVASQIRNVEDSNIRHGGIPTAVGQKDRKSKSIRIDYVQHAICGVMRAIDAGIPLLNTNKV